MITTRATPTAIVASWWAWNHAVAPFQPLSSAVNRAGVDMATDGNRSRGGVRFHLKISSLLAIERIPRTQDGTRYAIRTWWRRGRAPGDPCTGFDMIHLSMRSPCETCPFIAVATTTWLTPCSRGRIRLPAWNTATCPLSPPVVVHGVRSLDGVIRLDQRAIGVQDLSSTPLRTRPRIVA